MPVYVCVQRAVHQGGMFCLALMLVSTSLIARPNMADTVSEMILLGRDSSTSTVCRQALCWCLTA